MHVVTGLVQAGGVAVLRSAIRQCKNLQVPAMHMVISLAGCLSLREDIAELVASEGITSDLVLSLKTHTRQPVVVTAAFRAISLLAPFVTARHSHIIDVAIRTIQQGLQCVEIVELGCNVLWRLISLGSDALLVKCGGKALLETVIASAIGSQCPSAEASMRLVHDKCSEH